MKIREEVKEVQHYVSQGILRFFSENKKAVYEYNYDNGKVYPTSIHDTMSEKYTYEHPLLKVNALEDAFGQLERKYIPVMAVIVEMLDSGDIRSAKKTIEHILKYALLFYYRSGAILFELRNNGDHTKAEIVERILKLVYDDPYLDHLAKTIINDYSFMILKSPDDELALSDQYISTASLNCKGKIFNYSNRTIGFSDCLILLPLSARYYVAYYNGAFELGNACAPDDIYFLKSDDVIRINKVIIKNSYRKCIAMRPEILESIKLFRSSMCGPIGTIVKHKNGLYSTHILKKEVFYYDEDEDVYENYVKYYSELIQFEKQNGRRVGRNDVCLCGNGKKFKNCCLKKYEKARTLAKQIAEKQEDWLCTKGCYVEKPIDEFWVTESELPQSAKTILEGLRSAKASV